MSISVSKLKSKFRNVSSSSDGDGKKTKAKAAAAVALAATLATGAVAVNDKNTDLSNIQTTNAVVQDIEEMNQDYSDDDKKAQAEVVKTSSVRETISKIISVPLYAIGAALMKAWEMLASSVLAPIFVIIMKWVIITAAILVALAICFKTAFPNVPLKKILNWKCIRFVLIGTAVGSVICEILPFFWEDAETYIYILHVILGFAVFMPVFCTVTKVFNKKNKKEVHA